MSQKPTYEELEQKGFSHKQADQKSEAERERMDIILSALKTGLALINPDLTVAWVNAAGAG